MKKLLWLIFALVAVSGSAAYGMPVATLGTTHVSLIVQVGYGCGLGVYHGPLYACAPTYSYGGYDPYYRAYVRGYHRGYYRGYYAGRRSAYYPYVRYVPGDVVYVTKGVCGFGSYLSCSYGTCWRFCQ